MEMTLSAPYSPKAIANAFLQRAFNDKKRIGHMQLQKLVYLAHGYHLASTNGIPLVDEPFEAWDYGPVCRTLYQSFRDAGRTSITRLATELDWGGDELDEVPVPAPVHDRTANKIIDFVYKEFANLSPFALSDLSHKPDWAWDRTRKADKFGLRNKDIDNSMIQDDFKPYIRQKTLANA